MIHRSLSDTLLHYASRYPIVTLTGPRQSGKSTLLKHLLKDYRMVSLEDPDVLTRVKEDPRLFLRQYADRTIIDEAQRCPELFSYLQSHVDEADREGMYILSGSHNFLLMEGVTQSLAGRTALLKLLPLSLAEIRHWQESAPMDAGYIGEWDAADFILRGGYPRLYQKGLEPSEFHPFYIQTYVERDVRLVRNITDLQLFSRFIRLCAGRIGQLLNLSNLANECGITQPTARQWLSLLESSYIVHLLRPYHRNFSKQLVKTPKLYFHDTGLACSLLGIQSADMVRTHYLGGALFENLVITEAMKSALNQGREPSMWFWRDHVGHEIDLLIEQGGRLEAIEIKSGMTYHPDVFKGIAYWRSISGAEQHDCRVIYGGEESLTTRQGRVVSWKEMSF